MCPTWALPFEGSTESGTLIDHGRAEGISMVELAYAFVSDTRIGLFVL